MTRDAIIKKKIPKNTPYCYTPISILKNGTGYKIKPCPYLKEKYNREWGRKLEYCTLLKKFLDIQDMIKDCGINKEW